MSEKPTQQNKTQKGKEKGGGIFQIDLKPTRIRLISQIIFVVVAFYLTFFFFSRITSICWADPFWHLQALFANGGDVEGQLFIPEGDLSVKIAVYSIGFLGIFVVLALLFGRLFCGWICPFGSILQFLEVISPIKNKVHFPEELKDPDIKYLVLFSFILLAILSGQEAFCEFCPAGTIFKGTTGHVLYFSIPVFIIVMLSVMVYGRKTWCSYLCPLGAFFGIFSKFHIFGIKPTGECVKCLTCNKNCPMDILIAEKYIQKGKPITDGDCIKCMQCIESCPRKILKFP